MKLRATFAVLALVASQMASAAYDQFFVFGDSLSDTGNATALSGGAFPGTPSGTASNGPVAADYIAQYFGVSGYGAAFSPAGGSNYAVIGATTDIQNFNHAVNQPAGVGFIANLATTGMSAQVGQFFLAAPTFNPNSTLFMVWGGPNDLFLGLALGADLAVVGEAAVGNLASIVGGLFVAGAKTVLVPLMPDLALTPLGRSSSPADAAALSLFTAGFNAGLTAAMAQIEAQTGINVILADTTAYLSQVLANPGFYGFTNTTEQCIESVQALLTNCQGYLFTDEIHPTTLGHRVLAASFIGLVPEPGTAWLLLPLAAGALAARRRGVSRQC